MALIEINWRPDRRRLRGFGLAAIVAFGALGAWIFFRHTVFGCPMDAATAQAVAGVLWAVAGISGVLALVAPRALRPLYLGLSLVSAPVGFLVSHLALAGVYYLVVTPIGLVMRLLGHDPLHRRFDPDARTYWVRRGPSPDAKRSFRQF
ncbi:MAG TPA: SxtJ family membrane protein [Phycisphaerae bacterium]|nr:SxtJ family membrane protein [Phycisphaerae bacterium]